MNSNVQDKVMNSNVHRNVKCEHGQIVKMYTGNIKRYYSIQDANGNTYTKLILKRNVLRVYFG